MYNIPTDIHWLIEAKRALKPLLDVKPKEDVSHNHNYQAIISIRKKNSESALMASLSAKRFTNVCVFGGTNYGKYREFVKAATHLGCVSRVTRDGGSQVLDIIPKPMAVADIIGKTNGEELVVSGFCCLSSCSGYSNL
ncbi:hypothetical protein Ddye_026173 [Dipteronia dyeriana]|uniref:Uncharacterized protein n=1 Tax=Dipteronia dyeriana TaxID=168575 RepID=A0AAD9TMI3_9ROSI|nr:hypothetical protein Ddye_026173 [Dipteronia dyeriana]